MNPITTFLYFSSGWWVDFGLPETDAEILKISVYSYFPFVRYQQELNGLYNLSRGFWVSNFIKISLVTIDYYVRTDRRA